MPCLCCGGPVPPSLTLTEAEFCSGDHRLAYEAAQCLGSCDFIVGGEFETAQWKASRPAPEPVTLLPPVTKPELSIPAHGLRLAIDEATQMLPLPGVRSFRPAAHVHECQPSLPCAGVLNAPTFPGLGIQCEEIIFLQPMPELEPKSAFWSRVSFSPRRLVWLVIPVVLICAFRILGPAVNTKIGNVRSKIQAKIPEMVHVTGPTQLTGRWAQFKTNLRERAAINLSDDFRTGLEEWRGRSDAKARWSYDAAGFVHPGALALYRPTLGLTNYRLDFLAELDQGLGVVFRATSVENYYAVELRAAQPGPVPRIQVVRYAVVGGREGPHVVKALAVNAHREMLQRVGLEVRDNDFTLIVQDQVADYWHDSRLASGGVGFFSGRGAGARVRWVKVSHQYDVLGRLCAYLAPSAPVK